MGITNLHLSDPFTVLNNRTLWYDGESSYSVSGIVDKLLNGERDLSNVYATDENDFSVKQFNRLSENDILRAKPGLTVTENRFEWNIPEDYRKLPIPEIVNALLARELRNNDFSELEVAERIERTRLELKLWEEHKLFDLLRVLIFIVDSFTKYDIVWGTGRGSSCSSYILYLIGLHDVDSVHYDLKITEFFRT